VSSHDPAGVDSSGVDELHPPKFWRVTQHDGWIQNAMMEILHGNLMESPENRHKHTREREREREIYTFIIVKKRGNHLSIAFDIVILVAAI